MTIQTVAAAMPAIPQELLERAQSYAENARAENTRRAYRSDWRQFESWCSGHGLDALPASPATVGIHLAAMADRGYKPATIQRRLTAITYAHRAAGYELNTKHPAIRELFAGIRRTVGAAQVQKQALLTEDVRAMVRVLPDTTLGLRDRALLLLGFAGAFRRSELVGLDVSDLRVEAQGLVVHLGRSKTDQEGEGREVAIPYGRHSSTCPVTTVLAWIQRAGIDSGPLFRSVNRHGQVSQSRLSDKAVALVVKRAAAAAGLDPADYAGHSLRSGMATSAARAGASERAIMEQTGHKSTAMVRRYIRRGLLFADCAANQLGL